jgi:hypothetical protein
MLVTCIREVLSSNLDRDTGYPHLRVSIVFHTLSGKCHDRVLSNPL